MDLKTAYQFHRTRTRNPRRWQTPAPLAAWDALNMARADMVTWRNAKAHYETIAARHAAATEPDERVRLASRESDALKAIHKAVRYLPARPSVSYQKPDGDSPRHWRERLAYVESPESFGLRFVGRVTADSYGGRDCWDTRDSSGWYTDPYGDTFKDGTGLCYGVVYQLPGRHGDSRFVSGYQFGGTDGGPCLDLGTVHTEPRQDWDVSPQDIDAARVAARVADSMAEHAAERERDYQTGWQMGQIYADAGDEMAQARTAALKLLAERRKVKGTESFPAICEAIRGTILGYLATIREARKTRLAAVSGDAGGLCVYMGDAERDAFCDAAGLKEFPA